MRGLALSVVQAVEGDDIGGAVAGAKALVTFLESLVSGGAGDDGGGDDGVRAGLAFVVSPAPGPVRIALPLAA
ncbi:MAG: hypothetical protein JW990_15055 [Thermoleophilia bacterium]|nr:hypothetical protein [Thermoleophilia bacterium]